MEQLALGDSEKEKRTKQLDKIETQYLRARRVKLSTGTFKTVNIIGRGSFGEVCLELESSVGQVSLASAFSQFFFLSCCIQVFALTVRCYWCRCRGQRSCMP